MSRPYPLIEVVWEDTTNIAEWQTHEEMVVWARAKGWIARNVGYLVYEDQDCVVVAARVVDDHEQHVGLAERIPRQAILEINQGYFEKDGQCSDVA